MVEKNVDRNLMAAVVHLHGFGFVPTKVRKSHAEYGDLWSLSAGGAGGTVVIQWSARQIVWEQLQLGTMSGWCYSAVDGFAPHVKRDFDRLLESYEQAVESGNYELEPELDGIEYLGAGLSRASCEQLAVVAVNPCKERWLGTAADAEYLLALSEKLMGVPTMYGTDQSDCDELRAIAARLLAKVKN